MKKVYIVLSQTGTALSKILKLITGAEYNHASISLDGTLHELYSFGRVYPRNPVIGGFVRESKNSGTFKRFCKTKIIVLQTEVSDDIYCKMQNYLCYMYKRKKEFGYNLDTKEGYEENKEKVFGLVAEYLDSGDVDAIDLFNELQEEMTRNGFLKKMFEREVEKATEQANTKN